MPRLYPLGLEPDKTHGRDSFVGLTPLAFPSELVVSVSSSQGTWAASSNAPWLEARQIGNNLVLNADANETLSLRKAQIVVTTAGLSKVLLVEQAAYPTFVVETDPSEISFGEDEGEMRLLLRTNATDWTIENPAEDWLEVKPRPHMGELVLKVEANETTTPRTADLVLESASQRYTLRVSQRGQLHLYLPHIEWGADLASVERTEYARRSKLVSSPNPRRSPRIPDYTFETASKAFPEVKYEFVDFGDKTLYVTTLVGDPKVARSKEFYRYLESEGFERITPEGAQGPMVEFAHQERKIKAYIYLVRDNRLKKTLGVVFFCPIHAQPGPQPTLEALELGIQRFGDVPDADVQQWEEARGGRYDKEFSDLIGSTFYFAPEPFYARGYFYTPEKPSAPKHLRDYVMLYTKHQWGIYRFGGMDYLTREFEDLLTREGFVFVRFNPHARAYLYSHPVKKLGLSIKSMAIGKYQTLRIDITPLPSSAGTSGASSSATEALPSWQSSIHFTTNI